MADLRSEIEARKLRIAELRKQREAHESGGIVASRSSSHSTQKLSFSIPESPQIEVDAPFLYEKRTQTDPFGGLVELPEENHLDQDHLVDGQLGQDQYKQPKDTSETSFEVKILDHVPPQLLTFIDDSWRSIARSITESGVRSIRNLRITPQTQIANEVQKNSSSGDDHALTLSQKFDSGARNMDFSPFHAGLIASLTTETYKISLWDMDAPESPEYTLRSPTKLTNILFSHLNASFLFASGVNGQVLTWDLSSLKRSGGRFDILPMLRSPIDSSECSCLSTLGASLISLNEDGLLRVWAADKLSKPTHLLVLEDAMRPVMSAFKLSAIVPCSFTIWSPKNHIYGLGFGWKVAVVGTITGHLLRLPNSASAEPVAHSWRHSAAVTCLSAQPSSHEDADNVKVLSGGLDWCICIWKVPLEDQASPTLIKRVKIDYAITSVCWHPIMSNIFAAGGEKRVQIYDTNKNKPLVELTTEADVKQLKFNSLYNPNSKSGSLSIENNNSNGLNQDYSGDLKGPKDRYPEQLVPSELAVSTISGLYLYKFDKL